MCQFGTIRSGSVVSASRIVAASRFAVAKSGGISVDVAVEAHLLAEERHRSIEIGDEQHR
jgi:hypothetical protein